MNRIDYPWEIVVLVSDDMIPRSRDMMISFAILCFLVFRTRTVSSGSTTDTRQTASTRCVSTGGAFYDRQGYIYHPSYKSLFCDTELTDLCRTDYKDICALTVCVLHIRHEHPGTGFARPNGRAL
jgi:hypothetical protein